MQAEGSSASCSTVCSPAIGQQLRSSGGALALGGSLMSLRAINCSVSGNAAGSGYAGGALYTSAGNVLELTNCLIWNNAASGQTDTNTASLGGATASLGGSQFSHCLIENWTADELSTVVGGSTNNLNGEDGDQQENLKEYAFGLAPDTSDSRVLRYTLIRILV